MTDKPALPVPLVEPPHHRGITIIAVFKLIKGTVLIAAALGALQLRGHSMESVFEWVVDHTHLAPEGRLVHWLWSKLGGITDGNLATIGEAGLAYGVFQLVESYGLFRRRKWAEWLVVIATSLPVPVEFYELFHAPSLFKLGILAVNLGVAGYLWHRRADFMTRTQRKAYKAARKAGLLAPRPLPVMLPAPRTDVVPSDAAGSRPPQ